MRQTLIASVCFLALVATVVCAANEATSRPWDGYPKVSPFQAVRYRDAATPEVKVAGTWYELLALNDLSAADVVKACQSLDAKDWQKRFEEDLVEVLTRTGHAPPKADKADLKVKDLSTGDESALKDVPMTHANRQGLVKARNPQK
jgi:hypothetical protein